LLRNTLTFSLVHESYCTAINISHQIQGLKMKGSDKTNLFLSLDAMALHGGHFTHKMFMVG
jgi:hypothetical protein